MEIRIRIDERALFVLLIAVALVSVVGITMAAPPNPGHSWSDVECSACIGSSNLADNSVTASKVQFNYAGSSSEGGPASSAESVDWTDIDNIPSGFADGTDEGITQACTWTGWQPTCTVCDYGYTCSGNQIPVTQLNCQNGVITGTQPRASCCQGTCEFQNWV
jgi:hypothetical protein